MNGAYVHCRIAGGGALNVLKNLIKEDKQIYKYTKQPKIFTIYSSLETLEIEGEKYKIITALPTWINNIFTYFSEHHVKVLSSLFDYRNLMPIYPILMKLLSKKIQNEQPNHILISSFAVAKNIDQARTIKTQNKGMSFPPCQLGSESKLDPRPRSFKRGGHKECVKITLYLHSPMQYIRSHHEEYTGKLTGFKGRLFKKITNYLRKRDSKFTHYDTVRANSEYTAIEGKKRYRFESIIKYPEINPLFLENQTIETADDYFVCVGRLVRFVREVDVIIKLFNTTKERLLIIGSGPDQIYLQSIAGNSIIFLGQLNPQDTAKIIKKSRGLINLTKESFGIGTAEALCLGIPVFGYNQGATPELVDVNSGILVENKTLPHLTEKFKDFTHTTRDKNLIAKQAQKKFH